jgi:vacuolar protein sorting-associated protein IST1
MGKFFGGFSASELKPRLKMATNRFQIAIAKKTAIINKEKREIALMLAEHPLPKEEKARIRTEALIRDDNTVEAMEILQLECELLYERIKLLSSQNDCPPDLVSCIFTVIWASQCVDVPELQDIRKQFRSKYGKKFDEAAITNAGGICNERVVAKLSIEPPSAILVQVRILFCSL